MAKSHTFQGLALRDLDELNAPMRAAIGDLYGGLKMAYDPIEDQYNVTLYVSDDANGVQFADAISAFTNAVANIDRNTPPPSEQRRVKLEQAREAIQSLDFKALKTSLRAAKTLADLQPILETAIDSMARIAALTGAINPLDLEDQG